MPYGVCFSLEFSSRSYATLKCTEKSVSIPAGSWSLVEGCKFLGNPQAEFCVQGDIRFKEINFFPPHNYFRATAETQLYYSQTEAIFSCCDSWKQAQDFLCASPGKNLQWAEGCSYVLSALIGPYTASRSISSVLIESGKDWT